MAEETRVNPEQQQALGGWRWPGISLPPREGPMLSLLKIAERSQKGPKLEERAREMARFRHLRRRDRRRLRARHPIGLHRGRHAGHCFDREWREPGQFPPAPGTGKRVSGPAHGRVGGRGRQGGR